MINARYTWEHSPCAREASDRAPQSLRFFAGPRFARMSKNERQITSPSPERLSPTAPATPEQPCKPGTLSACQKHAAGRIFLPPTHALAGNEARAQVESARRARASRSETARARRRVVQRWEPCGRCRACVVPPHSSHPITGCPGSEAEGKHRNHVGTRAEVLGWGARAGSPAQTRVPV